MVYYHVYNKERFINSLIIPLSLYYTRIKARKEFLNPLKLSLILSS